MYKVEFRSQRGDAVETGTFLVCARNTEDAEAMVSASANLPPSATTFDTHRVKPSIYEISRRDFRLSELAWLRDKDEPGAVHEVRVSAKVFGYSESSVLRRLANAIVASTATARGNLPKNVNDFDVSIERSDHRPRPSRVEEQSIYKEKRFFSGGAARPR